MCTSLLQIPLSLEENVESLKIGVPWVYMPPDMGIYGTSPLEEEKVLLDDESSLLPSRKISQERVVKLCSPDNLPLGYLDGLILPC